MSNRICGLSCHSARRAKCNCWCGGLFHGAGAEEARKAFIREYGFIPAKAREDQAFKNALEKARGTSG